MPDRTPLAKLAEYLLLIVLIGGSSIVWWAVIAPPGLPAWMLLAGEVVFQLALLVPVALLIRTRR